MNIICECTVIPSDLTAEETVYRLFDYWNSGNRKGESLLYSADFDISEYDQKGAYSFYEDVIRRETVITSFEDKTDYGLQLYSDEHSGYCDRHYYAVSYTRDTLEIDFRGGGWAIFFVARQSPDEPYKICSMFTGR